jgi:hypothetical protein
LDFIGFPIGEQFLAEALLLAVLGGVAGTVIGVLATGTYAASEHRTVPIPAVAFYGGGAAALAIGASPGCARPCGPPGSHRPRPAHGVSARNR